MDKVAVDDLLIEGGVRVDAHHISSRLNFFFADKGIVTKLAGVSCLNWLISLQPELPTPSP